MDSPSDTDRPASAGDAESRFTLAMRLFVQANTLEKFERAAALIEESSGQGHAEATAMLATMDAVGAGRARDWKRAFDRLELAARQGSERARRQLQLLAHASSTAETDEAAQDVDWRDARGRIDIERLLQFSAPFVLSETPRLRVFEGFASQAECRWIIERFGSRLGPAQIWDETGTVSLDARRTNSAVELLLNDMDVVTEIVKARISAATGLPEFIFEVPQLMRYSVGQEFKPHYDFLDPEIAGLTEDLRTRGQRMGTFLIYLNDDYEGGETQFPAAGLTCRGRTGDALFFANVTRDGQPDPLTLHAGLPPTRGEKWIFSQWIRDRPPVGLTNGAIRD